MSKSVAVILLAAGKSSRMRGADKLLEMIGGETLLERQARTCTASTATATIVVFGPNQTDRREILAELDVKTVIAKDAARGMSASLKAGVQALPCGISAALILPADMPEITSADLDAVINAYTSTQAPLIRGASQDGQAGHPVLFDARYFPQILQLEGDQGARPILEQQPESVHLVTLPGEHAHTDLDTPEDWARWRNETI